MLIHVRDGKGGKNRFAMLSPRLLHELREYWRAERPVPPHLFPGRRPGTVLTASSVQQMLARTARRCGITKHVTPHTLRHSFAAHMLELGTDIRVIQVVLGHRSIRTTQVYAHVSSELIARARSPLDLLGSKEAKVLG
jgi:site-specific recombinase XerD